MIRRLWWFWKTNRLGPDMLSTHWLLYFKRPGRWLCRKKFRAFGEGSEFRPHAHAACTDKISIGRNVIIHPGTMLQGDDQETGTITIEDDVSIGAGVHVYVDTHRFHEIGTPIKYQGYYPSEPVVLKRGSWIGACAIILPGVTVGENAVVGAGSVITRSVEPYTVVAGNPARKIKDIKSMTTTRDDA